MRTGSATKEKKKPQTKALSVIRQFRGGLPKSLVINGISGDFSISVPVFPPRPSAQYFNQKSGDVQDRPSGKQKKKPYTILL